jgi:16S rRNA (guanine(966)-N(2))-methyltransferase RsmD
MPSKRLKTRVLGGAFKGRTLSYPADRRLRPTMQRTKESVFESLGARLVDSVFVDLYAAAGGIGIEALSRGAHSAHFVENDPVALGCLRDNLAALGVDAGRGVVHRCEVKDFLSRAALRDISPTIVFADPPYADDETRLLLEFFSAMDYPLRALFVLEHHKRAGTTELFERLGRVKFKMFGQSCVSYFELMGGDAR